MNQPESPAPSVGQAGGRLLWGALGDVWRGWVPLATSDLVYKAFAFAVLMPMVGGLTRLVISHSGSRALADLDIARFLFMTGPGLTGFVLVMAVVIAAVGLEQSCLMMIGLGRLQGEPVRVRDAVVRVSVRSFSILRLTFLLVLRLLVRLIPFAAALGGLYWILLRQYDINYYLHNRPPAFWVSAALSLGIVVLLVGRLGSRIASWLLALPIVLFEGVFPIVAFRESARRMKGHRGPAALALGGWVVLSVVLTMVVASALKVTGRALVPLFSDSMPAMLLFLGSFAIAWFLAMLALAVLEAALFSQILVRLYVATGTLVVSGEATGTPRVPLLALTLGGRGWAAIVGGLAVVVLAAAWLAGVVVGPSVRDHSVLVIAHRGASAEAPQNTLAAFRLACDEGADFNELDVQESVDGEVLVIHDADLMQVAGSPLKVWQSTAEQIRTLDVGSSFAPAFADQRVPTLAEALAACEGRSRVDIELKDYGHSVRLEERVVAIVEAAGMVDQIITMSLSPEMVTRMKALRPGWTSGLLAARAIGSVSELPGDFLAVQAREATRRFIRAAHAAGKPVYVWTVDDPAQMVFLMGIGADGIITNRPALGRDVVARYAGMTQVERLFFTVMVRLGAKPDLALDGGPLAGS